jgi:hypothetical protein
VSRRLREIAAPFVAAAPAGARVRTRLRVSGQDEAVLRAVGRHLGTLAGCDLAARCAEGRLGARGRVSPDGNATGAPFTIPLQLGGLPATARDGHVRAAVTRLIATAREHGAQGRGDREPGFHRGPSGGSSRASLPPGSETAWCK